MHITDQDLTPEELEALGRAMFVVERLPRDAVDRVVRHLLRVGLYFRRTGEVAALRTAFDSLGHMVRKNADEQYQKRSAASRDEVSRSLGPEELLAALGN